MSQQTQAQEVTSHFPVARLVTIGHFQSEQSLVVVAQLEEHALSVSPIQSPCFTALANLINKEEYNACCREYNAIKYHHSL